MPHDSDNPRTADAGRFCDFCDNRRELAPCCLVRVPVPAPVLRPATLDEQADDYAAAVSR